MGTSDNFFFAQPDRELDIAFETRSEGQGKLPRYRFGVVGYGSAGGVVGCGGTAMTRLFGPYSTLAGVHGTARDFTGVAGTSVNRVGVYGQVGEPGAAPDGLHAGVLGSTDAEPAVVGWSTSREGVFGVSFNGFGMRGASVDGEGVYGYSEKSSGVMGVSQGGGPVVPNTTNIAGVLGTSDAQPGVIGTSNTFAGVYGFSNNVGVVGLTTNPASYAGVFAGNVIVSGTLTATVKNGVVAFPDGTQRVLHCMESPEHWFEDFGSARLNRGRATVKLDADFAKVVTLNGYRVFLTPEGDCKGLYVRSKRGGSFEVGELQGGTSNVAFSYRIVAKRKDVKRHTRFAKIDTRLPMPAAPARPPRATKPTAAALRKFIARMEKEARERAPKGVKRGRRLRARPKLLRPRMVLPPRPRTEKK